MKNLIAAFVLVLSTLPGNADDFTKFPAELDPGCRYGHAKLYDECTDQVKLFDAALNKANEEKKTLLVSYGAEWCIWCHVFDAYLSGEKTKFEYAFEDPDAPEEIFSATLYERESSNVSEIAKALNALVRENFVIVHIENLYAPNGSSVLQNSGALEHYTGGIPFIFAVDQDGMFVREVDASSIETRRDSFWDWYRGYQRELLIKELQEAHSAVVQKNTH